MLDFKKLAGKKETASSEVKTKFEIAVREVDELSQKATEHKAVEKVSERGKFLKLGSHKVTGKELNDTTTHIDESMIAMKNVQLDTLRHIIQLYRAVDALDEEHIAGILTALKAAETATDWARVNDENIGKITSYLLKDERVIAHETEQMTKITSLESKLKTAYLIACSSAAMAIVCIVLCIIALV